MKIGVFDSGVGGLSVQNAIKKAFPEHTTVLYEDHDNLPYGTKTPEQLLELTLPIFRSMVEAGCDAIVVACNTVTTNIISELREEISVPLVGMEPMIKPASEMTKSKIVAVFATPATLSSKRYAWLKAEYADGVEVLEPDCSDWASMIENDQISRRKIEDAVGSVIANGADVIVLGCTHYHWIEHLIKEISGSRALVLQPEGPVISRLKTVLKQLD